MQIMNTVALLDCYYYYTFLYVYDSFHNLIKQIQIVIPNLSAKAQMLSAIALIHTRTPKTKKKHGSFFLLESEESRRLPWSLLTSERDEPPQVPEVPLQGPARPHPDAPDGEPELLQPHADPRLHPRQRQRRRPGPHRRALLLQHLLDQVLRPDVPCLLRVHLVHLRVRERRRRPQQQHLPSCAVERQQQQWRRRGEEDGEEIRGGFLWCELLAAGCLPCWDVCACYIGWFPSKLVGFPAGWLRPIFFLELLMGSWEY